MDTIGAFQPSEEPVTKRLGYQKDYDNFRTLFHLKSVAHLIMLNHIVLLLLFPFDNLTVLR